MHAKYNRLEDFWLLLDLTIANVELIGVNTLIYYKAVSIVGLLDGSLNGCY